jgi:hypothetical protein
METALQTSEKYPVTDIPGHDSSLGNSEGSSSSSPGIVELHSESSPQLAVSTAASEGSSDSDDNRILALDESHGRAPELHIYTSKVKERGDFEGLLPHYSSAEREINGQRIFSYTVKYDQVEGAGSGRTKKEAKHKASKAVWELLA